MICLSVAMVESFHQSVDDRIGVLGPLLGQMKVGHGSLQIAVSHVSLNDPGIGARFEQMGGIAMAQRVHRYSGGFAIRPIRTTS